MVTFHLVMSKYWIGKGKQQYQIIQFTQKLVCTRSAVVTINGAIGGGIVGTVYRYVGSSSQSSQICLGSIARKSFIFIFLLAPEEGLFSNRNIGQFFKIYLVYTKTVDSVFRALWLATQTVNILHWFTSSSSEQATPNSRKLRAKCLPGLLP